MLTLCSLRARQLENKGGKDPAAFSFQAVMWLEEFLMADWWVPRSECGWFPPWLRGTYIAANVAIWAAYESIPLTLKRLAKRNVHIVADNSRRRFVTFIQFCGRGHLLDAVLVFWWPHYLVFTIWHSLTATVSVYTALTLQSVFRKTVSDEDASAIASIVEKGGVDIDEELQVLRDSEAWVTKNKKHQQFK